MACFGNSAEAFLLKLLCPAAGRLGLFGLCGFMLAACSVGPDYQKPNMPLPAHWSQGDLERRGKNQAQSPEQTSRTAPAGWWKRLNDPQLNHFVDAAIADNLNIAAAKARLREARAIIYQSAGALMPTLDGSADYRRRRPGGGPTKDNYSSGFDSAWELDIFGGNRRGLEAAQAGFAAAEEDLRSVMVSLIGDVAADYVELRRLQAQLALASETARSQRQTADLVKNKFQAGAVSSLDENNAAGQAADMEANIPRLQAQIAVMQHRLSVLLGQPPAAIAALAESKSAGGNSIPAPPRQMPAALPADILLFRPDVRAAERRLAQATALIGQRQAQLYPNISLVGNIATNSIRLGDLGKNSTLGWAIGPGLTLPLFHGGRLIANVNIARAQRDQNFITYRAQILTALEEVENALVSLKNDRLIALKKAEAATAYGNSLTLSRNLYQSGNTGFLELLNAERSYFSSRQGALDAQAATASDYISLMKALGGGWDGTVHYAAPEIRDRKTYPHFTKMPQLSAASGSADVRP